MSCVRVLEEMMKVSVKTGIGRFGSPIRAPMAMTAQFNILGTGRPSFFVHFRPRKEDFSIKRSVQSRVCLPPQSSFFAPEFTARADLKIDGSLDDAEPPPETGNGISFPAGNVIHSFFPVWS